MNAQQQLVLKFESGFGKQQIKLSDSTVYLSSNTDQILFDALKFYISNLRLEKDGKIVYKEPLSCHLIDFRKQNSTNIKIELPKSISFDHLLFCLGMDSITNVSGAMGGDLDPTLGMYWTWQSGYINFKLEGKSPSCPTRHHAFQFHLGGYLQPNASIQTIRLKTNNPYDQTITFDLEKFMKDIDLSKQNTVMSPGPEAVELSKRAASAFMCR